MSVIGCGAAHLNAVCWLDAYRQRSRCSDTSSTVESTVQPKRSWDPYMSEPQYLANAPIREAVINIRCEGNLDLEGLRDVCDQIHEDYPNIQDLRDKEFRIALSSEGPGELETVLDRPSGFRCETEDGKHVAQFRLDGITLSRLAPYEGWPGFLREFRRLWKRYCEGNNQFNVSRISTRYINSILLPFSADGQIDFDDYLVCGPQVPEGLPQGLSGYLTRMQIPDERGVRIVITQALEKSTAGSAQVLLDIDVLKDVSIDGTEEDKISHYLEELRDKKNQVFFLSLKKKALELFR